MLIDAGERIREIEEDLLKARTGYTDLWNQLTGAWRNSSIGLHGWLTYAANYLFSFHGYKWGLDPFAMSSRVTGMPSPDYRRDLAPLSLVVLTHAHNDHLDVNLIKSMKRAEVEWVIPVYVQELLRKAAALPEKGVITPVPGQDIICGPLRLLPFESLHVHGRHGVPETGYLVLCDGVRWLFPGDIRDYDLTRMPFFGRLDGAVAHLWLGKAKALEEAPPFLDAFCDFYTGLDSERLFVTHLNEFGRDEKDLWRDEHYNLVKNGLLQRKPELLVEKYLMGARMDLGPVFEQ